MANPDQERLRDSGAVEGERLTDPDDLPEEAYDPRDFEDLGGIGVEPR